MTKKRFIKYVPHSYGYTYITTIIDNEKNKYTGNTDEIVNILNELNDENKQLREENDLLKNSEAVTDQKELQKLIFGTIINLIDEKIKKYQSKPLLPIKMPVDCQYKQSCLHNQEINVCHKAKENAYRELKRELKE